MTEQAIYSHLPGFDEEPFRQVFKKAIPLKTLVVYCPDPRAAGIPAAVAREFGEVWPGEILRDAQGAKVGATTNVGQIITVGGRAIDALRSIATLNHMLGLERVVVVHHTFCGTTGFTPEGLYRTFAKDEGVDLRGVFDEVSLTITDFETSLRQDVELIRAAPGTPKHIDLYGYVYDVDHETLTKVVEDLAHT